MPFPIALAAIAGGSALIGGIANFLANKSAAERAEMLQNKALQEWLKVNIPDIEEQKIALQKFVLQGTLDPKLESAIAQNPSEFKNIVTSGENKSAQNRALRELEDIGYSGGLRLQDKAALQEARLQSQGQGRAGRQAVVSDMARRGLGGSGFDAAAQLSGQQEEADRESTAALRTGADAEERALQAIEGAGDLAGKYRSQEFDEKAQQAAAQDRINAFNTENMRDVNQRNTAIQNRDQELNLAEKQRIADQNTGLANYEQQYNKELRQKRFENEATVAAGKSGQYQPMAQNAIQQGANEGNLYSNIAGAASGATTAIAQQNFWDKYFENEEKKRLAKVKVPQTGYMKT